MDRPRQPHALLIIGYGNPLRGDDGVGPKVVESIESLGLPGVQTLVCHQLSPEHADPISRARQVVFVDAEIVQASEFRVRGSESSNPDPGILDSEPFRWRKLEPNESSQLMAHAADPRTMLALARDVFGHAPEAWWLTIPAVDLAFGASLSPEAQAGCLAAIRHLQTLAKTSAPVEESCFA